MAVQSLFFHDEQFLDSFTISLRLYHSALPNSHTSSADLFAELKEFVCDAVGGKILEKKYKLDQINYQFIFYDEEIDLIRDLFKLINTKSPDFVLVWNMSFDIPYLIINIISSIVAVLNPCSLPDLNPSCLASS